ncbi:MAG: ATP-binding protein, partial [Pseudomonadota bacterium]|nr:ATP-binding protein [Pseudomonadota bacterium]
PEDREAGLPAVALETAAREGRFEKEGWRVRKDGNRFWANVIIDPIRDETGTLIGFAKITRDITERREAEAALEQARAEALQSQKLAAVAQLASGIAHDFNNLLTVVMGNLDLLKRAREERRPRLIDNALHAVEEARKLTTKLLGFSRRQPLFPEPVDLNAMVAGMDDMLNQSLRGDIRLELDLSPDLWPVEIDRSQFQVALINLAVNARDAMPKGGVFRVRTENTSLQDGARAAVAVRVTDTGTGIPADVLSQVFEPFFTTKEVGEGTGLGLAQVHGFAEQSGGSVTIESQVGHGTTITLYLPKSEAQPKPQVDPGEAPPVEVRPLHILLVEDNAQVAEIAGSMLTERGHTIVRAANADEALECLRQGETFDLVFSDLVMPGKLDGLDLARSVRTNWPSVPVLLATGYSHVASRATGEGFTLLTKPYRPEGLITAIHQAIAAHASPSNVVPLPRSSTGGAAA